MSKKAKKSTVRKPVPDAVTLYELAKSGYTDMAIAKALGLCYATFRKMKERHPEIQEALTRGRNPQCGVTFKEYVYSRLPEECVEIWELIVEMKGKKPTEYADGLRVIDIMLAERGKLARQHLWVHAYIHSNFNASFACRMTGITRRTLDNWATDDPDFEMVMNEIHQHKKDFFEEALMDLVQERNPAAVIFANKTMNKDRGYADRAPTAEGGTKNVIHQHVHAHQHMGTPGEASTQKKAITVESMKGLTLEARRAILAAHKAANREDDAPVQAIVDRRSE